MPVRWRGRWPGQTVVRLIARRVGPRRFFRNDRLRCGRFNAQRFPHLLDDGRPVFTNQVRQRRPARCRLAFGQCRGRVCHGTGAVLHFIVAGSRADRLDKWLGTVRRPPSPQYPPANARAASWRPPFFGQYLPSNAAAASRLTAASSSPASTSATVLKQSQMYVSPVVSWTLGGAMTCAPVESNSTRTAFRSVSLSRIGSLNLSCALARRLPRLDNVGVAPRVAGPARDAIGFWEEQVRGPQSLDAIDVHNNFAASITVQAAGEQADVESLASREVIATVASVKRRPGQPDRTGALLREGTGIGAKPCLT